MTFFISMEAIKHCTNSRGSLILNVLHILHFWILPFLFQIFAFYYQNYNQLNLLMCQQCIVIVIFTVQEIYPKWPSELDVCIIFRAIFSVPLDQIFSSLNTMSRTIKYGSSLILIIKVTFYKDFIEILTLCKTHRTQV